MPENQAPESIDRLKAVLALLNDGITKKDFAESFKRLADAIAANFATMNAKIDARLSQIKNGRDGRDGKDGKDGKSIVGPRGEKGEKGDSGVAIFGPRGKDGRDGSPDTPEQVRDKLYTLEGDERLDKSAIKGLDEELQAIRDLPRGQGSGVSNLRIQQAFKYILKTEEPVGSIDGANTTYTLSQPIFAILSMSINGETIAQLPNYTISGNTFTFSSALPAVYSGKDWEVKYI